MKKFDIDNAKSSASLTFVDIDGGGLGVKIKAEPGLQVEPTKDSPFSHAVVSAIVVILAVDTNFFVESLTRIKNEHPEKCEAASLALKEYAALTATANNKTFH